MKMSFFQAVAPFWLFIDESIVSFDLLTMLSHEAKSIESNKLNNELNKPNNSGK